MNPHKSARLIVVDSVRLPELAGKPHTNPVNGALKLKSRKNMQRIATIFAALVLTGAGFASVKVAGRWSATIQGPQGPTPVIYNLTPKGDSLGGYADFPQMGGGLPIVSGRIQGDSVFFTAEGHGYTLVHAGRVAGDSLHLRLNGEQIFTAVRAAE